MRNVVEKKLRLFKGCVGTAVTVVCRSCVSVCVAGVGDNDRVHVFSQFARLRFPCHSWTTLVSSQSHVSMEAVLVREGKISDFLQGNGE